jgi:hypothetical protein
MTTLRQIKKLVQPLLAQHTDLVLFGQIIFVKPVRHVLRGILIDRTGEAIRFRPRWAVVPLCAPTQHFYLNWGAMLYKPGLWEWSDPSIAAALVDVVERDALPILRSVESLDDFVAFASKERFPLNYFHGFHLKRVAVEAACGDLAAARATCAELTRGRTLWSQPWLRESFDQVTKPLCPLLAADDRPGLVRLLREWEAYSVRQLKLETIWEPTPFPIELQAT